MLPSSTSSELSANSSLCVSFRYRILVEGVFAPSHVKIHYDSNRWSPIYSPEEVASIEAEWQEHVRRQPDRMLFNSRIFRLGCTEVTGEGDRLLHLYLGDTDYRQYVGTRSANSGHSKGSRSDPLGTAIILVTEDNFVPLGRRSQHVEVNPGRLFSFGGFFDASLDLDETGQPNIFACLKRELREELGIDVDSADFRCLGVVYDGRHYHPELCSTIRLQASRRDVEEAPWGAELADLQMVPLHFLSSFCDKHRDDITEGLLGGLELFLKHDLGIGR